MRDSRLYLKDILAAIESIEAFVEGMDLEAFRVDDKTTSAVIRKFEIISLEPIPRYARRGPAAAGKATRDWRPALPGPRMNAGDWYSTPSRSRDRIALRQDPEWLIEPRRRGGGAVRRFWSGLS